MKWDAWRDQIDVERRDGGLTVHNGHAYPANDESETTRKLRIMKRNEKKGDRHIKTYIQHSVLYALCRKYFVLVY